MLGKFCQQCHDFVGAKSVLICNHDSVSLTVLSIRVIWNGSRDEYPCGNSRAFLNLEYFRLIKIPLHFHSFINNACLNGWPVSVANPCEINYTFLVVPFQSRENLIALRSRCNLLESRLHISGVFRCTHTHTFRSAHANINKLENHERVGEASLAKFMKFFFYFEVVLRSSAFSVTSVAHFRFIKRNL